MKPPSVVVITGAGSGVGRATARAFASMGVAVGLIARGEDSLEAAAKEVSSAGGRALAISADVADAAAVERAAARVEEELGPLDVWVNNAMTSVLAPFAEVSPEEFRRVTEVTYLGQVYGTRAALARMLPRDHGAIVCVGSALAYRGIPLQSAYCGAKHAIQGFTESVRCELRHGGSHVRITMVQLPALNTPQFEVVLSRLPRRAQPVPPIYQPEVAARAIVWASMHLGRRLDHRDDAGEPARARPARSLSGPYGRPVAADQPARRPGPSQQPVGAGAGRPRRARPLRPPGPPA